VLAIKPHWIRFWDAVLEGKRFCGHGSVSEVKMTKTKRVRKPARR
jgi:hypothetical protein